MNVRTMAFSLVFVSVLFAVVTAHASPDLYLRRLKRVPKFPLAGSYLTPHPRTFSRIDNYCVIPCIFDYCAWITGEVPSSILESNFDSLFPSGLTLGIIGMRWIIIEDFEHMFLVDPGKGNVAASLNRNCRNCVVGSNSCPSKCVITGNKLLSETMTLALNVKLNDCSLEPDYKSKKKKGTKSGYNSKSQTEGDRLTGNSRSSSDGEAAARCESKSGNKKSRRRLVLNDSQEFQDLMRFHGARKPSRDLSQQIQRSSSSRSENSCSFQCDVSLADKILTSGKCSGLSVQYVLTEANKCLAGYQCNSAKKTKILGCVEDINSHNAIIDCSSMVPTPLPTNVPSSEPTRYPTLEPSTFSPTTSPSFREFVPECDPSQTIEIPFDFDNPNAEILLNNLGGFCGGSANENLGECGTNIQPFSIIYKNVGLATNTYIDLIVTNISEYVPAPGDANTGGHFNNGKLEKLGQINIANGRSVDLEFEFQEPNGTPIELSGYILMFDIDANCSCTLKPQDNQCLYCPGCENSGREFVSIPKDIIEDPSFQQYGDLILDANTNMCIMNETDSSSITLWASAFGDATDNPTDFGYAYVNGKPEFSDLTVKQRRAAGRFGFNRKKKIQITYGVSGPTTNDIAGRNLVFSAVIHVCIPTPAHSHQ